MSGHEFRKWIEAGYKNYGEDPWFFIRELAQNSRDAGAASIHVQVKTTPGKEEVLIFEDDGSGMSYAHAVRYLFRLYASSKTREKYAAGMFGIGFWTVLKFNPSTIIIESRYKNDKWGVVVDADLETTRIPSDLPGPGTRITLVRSPRESSGFEFKKKARLALERYCCYLRRNNRKADSLPVFFSGKNITQDMNLPGPVSLSFKRDFVEGAVGLGTKPQVQLYARGLPVWEGTSLEELSHTPPTGSSGKQKDAEIAQGLAPVFLLNGNNLEVNISRRRVIDNRNLQKVRKTAEIALNQMVELAADYVSPRTLIRQFSDTIKYAVSSIFRSFIKTLVLSLIVILPLEVFLLTSVFKIHQKGTSTPSTALPIQVEKSYYPGATVRITSQKRSLNMTYTPAVNTWFKIFTAEHYDIKSGFIREVDKGETKADAVPFPPVRCLSLDSDSRSKNSLTITIKIPEAGKVFLPQVQMVQPGAVVYSVDPGSITVNEVLLERGAVRLYPGGEVVVSMPFSGIIRYQCCPVAEEMVLTPGQHQRLTQLPRELSLPPAIEQELRAFANSDAGMDIQYKIQKALQLTVSLLRYDDSTATAKKYTQAQSSGSGDWFRKVTAIGSGDCDILNGVTVLFLRKMGVPARLVIGGIGIEGRILAGLHAWVEYFHQGYHIIDATLYTDGSYAAAISNTSPIPHIPRTPRFQVQRRNISQQPDSDQSRQRLASAPLIYSLVVLLFLLFFLFFFMVIRFKKTTRAFQPAQHTKVQDDLAGMVLHELLHPGTWGYDRGIRNFKLIPTITGERVSLRRALKLADQQKLFTIKRTDSMAQYLEKRANCRRISILDTGSPAFAPVVKLLPGAIHLDKVMVLQAVEPKELYDPRLGSLGPLVYTVNQLFSSKTKSNKIPPCMLSPGLLTGDFLDIDLSRLPSLAKWGMPKRFIAVNPRSSRIDKLIRLFQRNPQLAQFRFIRAIIKESNLVPEPREVILERISRQLLKEVK
jgi:hypothetical protein